MAVLDHYVQGSFTADGNAKFLSIPSDVDFIEVDNLTIATTPSTGTGYRFTWQRGMAAGSAIQYTATTTTGATQVVPITAGGFTLFSTQSPPGLSAQLSGSAISSATPPLVSSSGTGSLANGNTVEMYSCTGAAEFNGYRFTVSNVTPNTSFNLAYAPTIVAGTTCKYRIFSNNPLYYPRNLLVSSVSQATQAVVIFTETHGLRSGQELVFKVPSQFGMTQLDGLRGTIVAINTTTNSVTVNIDTTSFTAFAFPLTAVAAGAPYTPAQAIPFGDGLDVNTPLITSPTLSGATYNTGTLGIQLGSGANGPAGQTGNVIYWRAWKAEQIQTS